jgi:hypothetical protein
MHWVIEVVVDPHGGNALSLLCRGLLFQNGVYGF